ncbi:hypothetical protein N5P37_004231 [Trichoderma harzianum]|uniref:Uncharacterized protein n=1 Tax=Trichoderma harzianum CBS 226.95 TaxID=983964 RepID=A0A2T4ANS1_TRIHA|nr:hypothetical protein M431DRAFT_477762 [Trichoderma harzianum CBS 226.95]KAK0763245.1 hypothetical protein N5P37_004231 [Trichoderma harzianum]PTB58558.1 hypothetical protein M431DRAFT_477762 [Trichoderma harzianum CBS 226.95]
MRNNYLHSPGCCEPFGARVRSPIRGETLQSKGETLQSEARVSAVKSRAHAWMRWQSPPFEGEAVAEWLEGGDRARCNWQQLQRKCSASAAPEPLQFGQAGDLEDLEPAVAHGGHLRLGRKQHSAACRSPKSDAAPRRVSHPASRAKTCNLQPPTANCKLQAIAGFRTDSERLSAAISAFLHSICFALFTARRPGRTLLGPGSPGGQKQRRRASRNLTRCRGSWFWFWLLWVICALTLPGAHQKRLHLRV